MQSLKTGVGSKIPLSTLLYQRGLLAEAYRARKQKHKFPQKIEVVCQHDEAGKHPSGNMDHFM